MSFTGNWFDITFIVILLITSILAFLRGFIKDFFGFFNWLLAVSLTYALSPHITKLFDKTRYSATVIDLAVGIILFIALLIIISLITSKISKSLAAKTSRSIDGSLGFAFGFAKGYFLVSLIFSIIVAVYSTGLTRTYFDEDNDAPKKFRGREGPDWLVHSQSYKILEVGSDMLRPITRMIMKSVTKTVEDGQDKVKHKIKNKMKNKIIEKLDESEKSDYDNDDLGKGYNSKEIQKMNRLIESINKQD